MGTIKRLLQLAIPMIIATFVGLSLISRSRTLRRWAGLDGGQPLP